MKIKIKSSNVGKQDSIANTVAKTVAASKTGNIASRARGVKNIAEGISERKSARTGLEKARAWAKIGSGAFLAIMNDLHWYTKRDLNGFVNLNYGTKFSNQLGYQAGNAQSKLYQASYVRAEMYLMKPETGDSDWDQGISELYNTLTSANNGSAPFNKYAVERYVWNLRNLWAAVDQGVRLYRSTKTASAVDTTVPNVLIQAQGYNPSDISDNIGDLKMKLIKFQNILSVTFPLKTDLLNRAKWLFSGLYQDHSTWKACVYVPTLMRVGMLKADHENNTVVTEYFRIAGADRPGEGLITAGAYMSTLTDMLNIMLRDPTMSDVASIVQKAFGESAYYQVTPLEDNPDVPLGYDEEFLIQIKNAIPLSNITTNRTPAYSITPVDGDFIGCELAVTDRVFTGTVNVDISPDSAALYANNTGDDARVFVDMPVDNVTPAETIMATRLTCFPTKSLTTSQSSGSFYLSITSRVGTNVGPCGTEVVAGFTVLVSQINDTEDSADRYWEVNPINTVLIQDDGILEFAENTDFTKQIAWFPALQRLVVGQNYYAFDAPSYDITNTALVDERTLGTIHGFATVSLMTVPILIKQYNYTTINRN